MLCSSLLAVECYAFGYKGHVKNSPECSAKEKDAATVEEKDTLKQNVEVEWKRIIDWRNGAVFEGLLPTPMQ